MRYPKDFVFLGFTLKFISMALLKMMTTVNPLTGASVSGGSAYFIYNTDNIVWGTLASKSGAAASSLFDYVNANGTVGRPQVKANASSIASAAGAVVV